jgi:hypothetical protein
VCTSFVLPGEMLCLTDAFIYRQSHGSTSGTSYRPTVSKGFQKTAPVIQIIFKLVPHSIKSVCGEFPNLKLAPNTMLPFVGKLRSQGPSLSLAKDTGQKLYKEHFISSLFSSSQSNYLYHRLPSSTLRNVFPQVSRFFSHGFRCDEQRHRLRQPSGPRRRRRWQVQHGAHAMLQSDRPKLFRPAVGLPPRRARRSRSERPDRRCAGLYRVCWGFMVSDPLSSLYATNGADIRCSDATPVCCEDVYQGLCSPLVFRCCYPQILTSLCSDGGLINIGCTPIVL